MQKYLAALLVTVGILLVIAVPAFAQEEPPGQGTCGEEFPAAGSGACELNPGQSEASDSWHTPPPTQKPGAVRRSSEANEHDTNTATGRERIG
jgi:hypothetical protein